MNVPDKSTTTLFLRVSGTLGENGRRRRYSSLSLPPRVIGMEWNLRSTCAGISTRRETLVMRGSQMRKTTL